MITFIKQLKVIQNVLVKCVGSPARRGKARLLLLFGYFKHIVMKGIKDITKNVRVLPNMSLWARSSWPSDGRSLTAGGVV